MTGTASASDGAVRGARERVDGLVRAFAHEEAKANPTALDRARLKVKKAHTAFVHDELAAQARQLGPCFWLPPASADTVFLHAYSALFCVPAFTLEALARQPDRFSVERLPTTVHLTSAFVLDAFGYDRRTETVRRDLYWPSITIRMAHAARDPDKARISDAAMAYFGYQLVRAAEHFSPCRRQPAFAERCRQHFDYFGEFLRRADYPFSRDRSRMVDYARQVDHLLAGDHCAELLGHVLQVAPAMGAQVTADSLREFLPTWSARLVDGVAPGTPTASVAAAHRTRPMVEIEYCVRCGYRPAAVALSDAVVERAGQEVSRVTLIPSDGGRFEVRVDDELRFSGLRRGRPPTAAEIDDVLSRLGGEGPEEG